MPEELQHLIDRIQREGVENAEQKAAQIIAQAKERAGTITREAEEAARAFMQKAERDAEAYTARSLKTLEQASRDLLITIGQGVERIFDAIIRETLAEAMEIGVIQEMLVKITETYCAREGSESRLEYLLPTDMQARLVLFFKERFRQRLEQGVELRGVHDIEKGFKVSLVDDHLHHDFTLESIAEALAGFLRPHLSQIIHRVARESLASTGAA